MNGIRFYEEFTHKRKRETAGNTIALMTETNRIEMRPNQTPRIVFDCLSAVSFHADSEVAIGVVSQGYLTETCRRISEKRAREIHPAMFRRLDESSDRQTKEEKQMNSDKEINSREEMQRVLEVLNGFSALVKRAMMRLLNTNPDNPYNPRNLDDVELPLNYELDADGEIGIRFGEGFSESLPLRAIWDAEKFFDELKAARKRKEEEIARERAESERQLSEARAKMEAYRSPEAVEARERADLARLLEKYGSQHPTSTAD